MSVRTVDRSEQGMWRAAIDNGRAELLLRALDPECEFVVIETWDGLRGWHEAFVTLGPGEVARTRVVRNHTFDLLVSPREAAEIGVALSSRQIGSGLGCYQFRARPSVDFRLPDHERGRIDAMVGLGVQLAIDLPHEGELAIVVSPQERAVREFVDRLAAIER